MPERRDVHDVGIGRVDADLGDVARRPESKVPPRRAVVVRAVHAVAVRDIPADAGLAHADVDHVRRRRRKGDRAHRGAFEVAVADVLPVDARVVRTPDASAGRAEVEDVPLAGMAGDGNDPAGPIWPDAAPRDAIEHVAGWRPAGFDQ
jgi:hypothetical protein